MKKLICLFVLVMLLSGCATVSYDGAQHQVYSGLCEQCVRQLTFTMEQWNNSSQIICPYCGRTQDLKMAYNRYVYLQQQQEQERQRQQALSNQVAVSNFFQSYQQNLKQSAQRQQKYNENIGNAALNWGGLKSTPNYQYIPAPSTLPSRQNVYWTPAGDGSSWHSSDGEMCVQLLNGGWKCSK